MREAFRKVKQGKPAELCEITTEMIVAGGKIAEKVVIQLHQRVMDGKEVPNEWKTSAVVTIFNGKEDVMSCGSYKGVKLLEHAMKIIERVLERRIRALFDFDEELFGFISGKQNNRCHILSTKVARRTLSKRQTNVHVFC